MAAAAFLPKSALSMSNYHNPSFHDYGDQVKSHSPALSQQDGSTDPSLFANEQEPSHITTPIVPGTDVFHAQSAKKRRASKGKIPSEIRRSASSPHIRGMAIPEVGSPTADKRRSKLGYHRTAVACGKSTRLLACLTLLLRSCGEKCSARASGIGSSTCISNIASFVGIASLSLLSLPCHRRNKCKRNALKEGAQGSFQLLRTLVSF